MMAQQHLDADDYGLDLYTVPDRLTPTVAGALAGLFAGPLALSVVHALAAGPLSSFVARTALGRGMALGMGFVLAYVASAAVGPVVGATFAVATRYLRRWLPLLLWAVLFFVCLAIIPLAVSASHGSAAGGPLTVAVLVGAAAFAVTVSFSLPIRLPR